MDDSDDEIKEREDIELSSEMKSERVKMNSAFLGIIIIVSGF